MLRKLDEKEIALIRMGIWPCCGEREVRGGARGGLMRNLHCPNCGTIVNIPAFKTSTEMMFQMCEMVKEPLYYDPQAVMRRLEITHEQIKNINIIMSPAPHEVRLQKKSMRRIKFGAALPWIIMIMVLVAIDALLITEWPSDHPGQRLGFMLGTSVGIIALAIRLWRLEHKQVQEQ